MIDIKWIVQKGYSIEAQLQVDGLSFQAFETIEASTDPKTCEKVKGKIVSRLCKELRSDCLEQELDISQVRHGVYCIALGTGFEYDYKLRASRIVYIGSGSVYGRINKHLRGKLFDFARTLSSIPLRFYIADLSEVNNAESIQRQLEQALLDKFYSDIDNQLPLLNKRNATRQAFESQFNKGWDRPLFRDKGRAANGTQWLIKAKDARSWKGAL